LSSAQTVENLYDTLELRPGASEEVIRAAAKALMAKYHPDRNNGDDRAFKRVSEALNILSDPKARARYEHTFRDESGQVIGEYRILSTIAEGGFGRTYKAEHTVVGELACIKHCHNLDKFDEEILIEEAKIMWNLRHYSIPAIRGMLRMPSMLLGLLNGF
jgi:curved DNA-binding protein CbpA